MFGNKNLKHTKEIQWRLPKGKIFTSEAHSFSYVTQRLTLHHEFKIEAVLNLSQGQTHYAPKQSTFVLQDCDTKQTIATYIFDISQIGNSLIDGKTSTLDTEMILKSQHSDYASSLSPISSLKVHVSAKSNQVPQPPLQNEGLQKLSYADLEALYMN